MKDPKIKVRKTHPLRLTKFELLHLRDLFSVTTSPELKLTVSQQLAKMQGHALVEAKLWQKVAEGCNSVGLPMGDDAPDFVIAAQGSLPVAVFELAQEPAGSEDEGFSDEDDDEDEDDVGGEDE